MPKIGLTLGKYAPFHYGHKYVIDTAAAEMDYVIVMVYEDDITPIPVHVRANWIRVLYSSCSSKIEVVECYNCPQAVGYTPEITQAHDEYILKTVGNRGITHFYSSEDYGLHVSKALGAIDRRVDQGRTTYNISATEIRLDPYRHRVFIPDNVYRDLIVKVVFLGAESTGKSTITKALARRYNTEYMPEYGAEYWLEHQQNMTLAPEELVTIARRHVEIENKLLLTSNKFLFIDTNAITTYMYAKDYHGYALPELESLAKDCRHRYDITILCEDDIPYDDTWDRRGLEMRTATQKKIADELEVRGIRFFRIRGSVEERVNAVEDILITTMDMVP